MRKSALISLRDAVQGMTGPDREVDYAIAKHFGWQVCGMEPAPRLTSSLDAAERFCKTILPGWCIQVSSTREHYYATVTKPTPIQEMFVTGSRNFARANHASEPIARVLATLNALIALEPSDA